MKRMAEKWRAFRRWQQLPHTVAPMSEQWHKCCTCATEFQGNYCPRCGQSASIGRYSFWKAFLLFLDVWGLGNRGMFRTLRDLILRPGYMIRDYLSGMQSAYFPPFKMFFLMTALSLIVQGGVNVQGINYFEKSRQEIGKTNDGYRAQKDESEEEKRVGRAVYSSFDRMANKMADYQQNYPNLFSLVLLLLSSGYLYFFFRKSPHIPDLRFSEFIVALVYVTNIVSLFSIVCDILCIGWGWQVPLMGMMWIVPMCQLSGFSWWKVSLILIVGIVLAFMSFFAIGLAFAVWMLK